MITNFKLPNDIYFWGQDRMGSLIPLLAQFFYKIFDFKEILAESITHYLLLLLGFLSFASFLTSKWYKLIFAIIWFFPPMHLIDVTQFAFGIHYCLIGMACYLIKTNYSDRFKENIVMSHFLYLLITLLLIAAVWVSDMAIISVTLLICVQVFYYFKNNGTLKNVFLSNGFYYILGGVFLGYSFISYAKSHSVVHNNYSSLGDLNVIWQTLKIFLESVIDLLLFKYNEPFTSIYAYLVILILCLSVFAFFKLKMNAERKKWFMFFALDAVIIFGAIICPDDISLVHISL
jgi:hypothetical protein